MRFVGQLRFPRNYLVMLWVRLDIVRNGWVSLLAFDIACQSTTGFAQFQFSEGPPMEYGQSMGLLPGTHFRNLIILIVISHHILNGIQNNLQHGVSELRFQEESENILV